MLSTFFKNKPQLAKNVKLYLGENVTFGKNVIIQGFKNIPCECHIDSNCRIGDNVRIIVSPLVLIGCDNVIHNNVSIVGSATFRIGMLNWLGQEAYIDTTGGLTIGNSNTLGIRSMIWSHMIRPASTYKYTRNPTPQVDNAKLTKIGNYCWTSPGSQVCPGIIVADKTILLNGAVLTKNTEYGKTYAGIPAKEIIIPKWENNSH